MTAPVDEEKVCKNVQKGVVYNVWRRLLCKLMCRPVVKGGVYSDVLVCGGGCSVQ